MKRLILLALSLPLLAQTPGGGTFVRWSATTGNVSLSGAGTTATIQQPATNADQVELEQIIVYCSVSCTITQSANGAAATSTAGTITPILPSPLNSVVTATFWTSSNVGNGTLQGGSFNMPSAGTQAFCLNTACNSTHTVTLGTGGKGNNYSVSISSITGTANITFYGASFQ